MGRRNLHARANLSTCDYFLRLVLKNVNKLCASVRHLETATFVLRQLDFNGQKTLKRSKSDIKEQIEVQGPATRSELFNS